VRRSNIQTKLEDGHRVVGMFAPAEAEYETPGVLTWTPERGAELELADLSDPWPTDFNETFVVHGRPHDGEPVTLLQAQVKARTMGHRTSELRSLTLALGAHATMEDRWLYSHYRPASLHEWLPETGLSHAEVGDRQSQLTVEWNAPELRTVALPEGELTLRPGADRPWSYAPDWRIETSMTFTAKTDAPLTITEHWRQFGSPLLSFCIFAVDRPDDLLYESYYAPDRDEQIIVLRSGQEAIQHEWRPTVGHYLFQAKDVTDPADALAKWFTVWHQTVPALGLLAEVIKMGNAFSPSRFLALFTAAEGYWRGTNVGGPGWGIDRLAERADVPTTLTKATKDARALIGAARKYHAHLRVPEGFTTESIDDQTYQSTRRLHVLLQACLLRDVGIDTSNVERLLKQHYQCWPIP
jgi:hypothetical protein